MSLTYAQLHNLLLAYCGTNASDGSIETNFPGITLELVRCVNGALAEIYDSRPDLFTEARAKTLFAARTGTVVLSSSDRTAVTLGTLSLTSFDNGSTIRIEGGINDSEIYSTDGGTTWKLAQEYDGDYATATPTLSATAWNDSWNLGTGYQRVADDAARFDGNPIDIVRDRTEWEDRSIWLDYGLDQPRQRATGYPEAIYFDTFYNATAGVIEARIRIAPMPDSQCRLDLDLVKMPPVLTTSDLAASTTFKLPGIMDDLVLVPFAKQRWTASPFFRTVSAKDEIARQFQAAQRALEAWDVAPPTKVRPMRPGLRMGGSWP